MNREIERWRKKKMTRDWKGWKEMREKRPQREREKY